MVKKFNEDTRVKLPATIQFLRLGYDYISIKESRKKNCIDNDNYIFVDKFKESIERINNKTFSDEEIEVIMREIHTVCSNKDLGKEFYNWLINPLDKVKLIDFENIENNNFSVCCELQFDNHEFDDSFRPDVNVIINGMPLAFLEVKRPNNPGGITVEFDRMEDRLSKEYFSKFFNMFQIISFSNNMEYENADNVDNLRAGSFYSTPNGKKTNYSFLREDDETYLHNYNYKKITDNDIEVVTQDCGYDVSNCSTPEFKYNLQVTTPCNRFITSLYDKERLLYLLKYGIMFIDGLPPEKHIMRYPQFFATRNIIRRFESGGKNGIIWHTQGSGKTALVAFANRIIRDYYSKQNTNTKFFFIVDRLDLLRQAKIEFENRGFSVTTCKNKEEFTKELNKPLSTDIDANSIGEICVVNIHKFEDDIPKSDNDYGINLQRVFFIDEAHRSYKYDGRFFRNLLSADENGIYIALTGTPLLTKRERTQLKFGDYIHKYFYDKSIADGYTLRIKKEDISTEVKEKIQDELKESDDTDLEDPNNNESPNYISSVCDFIQNDFIDFRKSHHDSSIGGMIVSRTNPQARLIYDWLKKNSELKVGLVISDDEQDEYNEENQIRFRNKGNNQDPLDILVVNRMLTTGYDVPRLKKLYLLRSPKAHSLLQTISRVNRPYTSPSGKKYKFGYIVDFVDIGDEFNITLQDYIKELEKDFNTSETEESLVGVVINSESVFNEYLENKAVVDSMHLTTDNVEIFSQQIGNFDKESLYNLRKNLGNMKDAYVELLISRESKYLNQIDYNNINNLFKAVNDVIKFKNLQEDPFDTLDDFDGEEMGEVVYSFKKIAAKLLNLGVEELDSKFDTMQKLLFQIRKEIQENEYRQDPQLIELDKWTKKVFNEFNEEQFDIDDIINELKSILEEIRKINEGNDKLKQKYGGNPAFVKTYHFISKNYLKLNEETKNLILNLIYKDISEVSNYEILINKGRRNFINQIKSDISVELYSEGIYDTIENCYDPILNEFYYNLKAIGEE